MTGFESPYTEPVAEPVGISYIRAAAMFRLWCGAKLGWYMTVKQEEGFARVFEFIWEKIKPR